MATSFRAPFNVIKRNMGAWVNGVYKVNDNVGLQVTVMATVQAPSERELHRIEATPYGRRDGRYIKIYTDTRLQPVSQTINPGEQSYPGDLFLYDGRTYLIFGEGDFTMLLRTRDTQVAHYRYFACEQIEGFTQEQAP